MAQLMMQKSYGDSTVTVCHSHSATLKEECLQADIIIAAIGRPGFLTADMVKPGATVIDVGTTRVPDASRKSGFRLSGDVDFDNVAPLCSFIYKLNRLLPPDVAVQAVRPVGPEMHARFSATRRTYHYYIHTRKNPFLRGYSWQVNVPLDFALMNEAAQVLLEYSDFTSFSKTGTDVKTNICQLTEARWEQLKPGEWRFTVSANRFLRNMVRAIVGTLVEVGRHRMTISQMRHAIEAKDRQRAGESVPGHALYLTNIEY